MKQLRTFPLPTEGDGNGRINNQVPGWFFLKTGTLIITVIEV